jgi:hypothetical protein
LTVQADCGNWDPVTTESSCLSDRRLCGRGTGMPGFGMMMTIITITTRFRGASG